MIRKLLSTVLTFAFATLATSLAYATGPNKCNEIAGIWVQNITIGGVVENDTYTLTKASDGTYSGNVVSKNCGGVSNNNATFPITNFAFTGNGGWTWTLPTQSNCGGANESIIIYSNTTGCDAFYIYNRYPSSFPAYRDHDELPGTSQSPPSAHGENASVFDIWNPFYTNAYGYDAIGAEWHATLNDSHISNFDFSGRTITETFTDNARSPLSCPYLDPPSPGNPWYPDDNNYSVGSANTVGDDIIGMTYALITEVQHTYTASLPCTYTATQNMNIDVSGGRDIFESHTITYLIGDGTFRVGRNGQLAPLINVGQTKKTWRWDDQSSFQSALALALNLL